MSRPKPRQRLFVIRYYSYGVADCWRPVRHVRVLATTRSRALADTPEAPLGDWRTCECVGVVPALNVQGAA